MITNRTYLVLAALAGGQFLAMSAAAAEDTPSRAVTATPAQPSAAPVVNTEPRPSPSCISDWSQAGPIVRSEGLATIEKVGRLARERASVEIVNSLLCKTEERYVYRLTVRSSQGALRTIIVDARQPFGQ